MGEYCKVLLHICITLVHFQVVDCFTTFIVDEAVILEGFTEHWGIVIEESTHIVDIVSHLAYVKFFAEHPHFDKTISAISAILIYAIHAQSHFYARVYSYFFEILSGYTHDSV